ncbi:Hsp20/alpha crystallin family protein [Phosphitispora sp. TUW77]|uniref:Hsp20/alpha crystallin family protein n=1 Tax=Phosphitispora sp. TUW77 TaxID=3152361 RepID=UPI003AB6DD64
MSLIPYHPFRQLENMRRELDRFFSDDLPSLKGLRQNFGAPCVDVYETENEVVATCDIPGLEKKQDVQIHIDNNVLSISGTVNRVNEIKDEHMHRQERFTGRFQRSIALPASVSSEDVKANYKNGVLEIHMLKLHQDNRRMIDIEFH